MFSMPLLTTLELAVLLALFSVMLYLVFSREKGIVQENLPTHIAIIPDGNRRWARKNFLLPWRGHERGVRTFREIIDAALELGIRYITFWAASEDNLKKRSKEEVRQLVGLLYKELTSGDLEEKLNRNKTRLRFIGRWEEILNDAELAEKIHALEKKTADFADHHLTIAFGYSGQKERIAGERKIVSLGLRPEEINSEIVMQSLWSKDLPMLDLIIRAGAEADNWFHWSSGFMMWHASNAKVHITKTLWPDFSKKKFLKIIGEFTRQPRRFGA